MEQRSEWLNTHKKVYKNVLHFQIQETMSQEFDTFNKQLKPKSDENDLIVDIKVFSEIPKMLFFSF